MTTESGLRVLLIEDNELDARAMTSSLAANRDVAFDITRVVDLESAIEALDTSTFDCILLDLSLPDSIGLVSVELLGDRVPDCPIVVLTGLDDPATALEAVERGAQDYLAKQTADSDTVIRSIRYAVARHHSDMALRSATEQLNLLRDRERIARDLHDTVIQQLFATGIGLQSVAAAVTDGAARLKVEMAIEGIDVAIRELREAIFGLHAVPQHLALAKAITELAEESAGTLGHRPIVDVANVPDTLPISIRREAIQIVREGLANVAKHADATATTVEVDVEQGDLLVVVIDNGRGLPGDARPRSADALTGRGLTNMEERAGSLNGRFRVGPGPGGGTRIEWRVPLTAGD